MTNNQNTIVCFSGHRSYGSAPEDEARLAAALRAARADGYRVFVSGMAPGFDLAAAEAVVRLRDALNTERECENGEKYDSGEARIGGAARTDGEIRLVAAVPFAGQQRGYSAVDAARYAALLEAADEVRVLAERYSHGCYYRRDDWMVERAGRIVCWYDGTKGGTRYTVRRAVQSGLEVVNVFRAAGSLF